MNIASIVFPLLVPFVSEATLRVGDHADYTMSTERARTSGFVRHAEAHAQVKEMTSEGVVINFDYHYETSFNSKESSERRVIPASILQRRFLDRLREGEIIETAKFKAQHLGFETVASRGVAYENCDIIKFYDVMLEDAHFKQTTIVVKTHPSVPFLGIVQVDFESKYMTGLTWRLSSLKLGMDYVPTAAPTFYLQNHGQ